MKKNGFTLIELLAVIVILVIIALISVPIILGVIETSRKGALEDSAYGIIDAAEMYYAANLETDLGTLTFDCTPEGCTTGEIKLPFKGKIDGSGTVKFFNDGKTALCISNTKYSVLKNVGDNKVTLGTTPCSYNTETNEYEMDATARRIQELEDELVALNSEKDAVDSEITTGKNLIATAITAKGVPTLNTDTFETMSNNIGNIVVGNATAFTIGAYSTVWAYTNNTTLTCNIASSYPNYKNITSSNIKIGLMSAQYFQQGTGSNPTMYLSVNGYNPSTGDLSVYFNKTENSLIGNNRTVSLLVAIFK